MNAALSALDSRLDLEQYTDNRHVLFALELHESIDDIHTVAAIALTDHNNDKACDLVYIDAEQGRVIVAQGYWSKKDRSEAPETKARALNSSAAWLLGKNHVGLPDSLLSAAKELESLIESDEVQSIEFWYVHNLPESTNVRRELEKVRTTADSYLRSHFGSPKVDVSAIEVGRQTLAEWYTNTQAPILVTDTLVIENSGGFEIHGDNWKAYSTSVEARWLQDLYGKHGRRLFSANVRDYLGSRRSDKNINHNIKDTAKNQPQRFWAYNNGITAIVNSYDATRDEHQGIVEIKGIAIVNGAQTTGALGSLAGLAPEAKVAARFVQCSDPNTVAEIIKYNNSQNKVEAADFRSNDRIQTRLRKEFEASGKYTYLGGRRGGEVDKITRTPNLIPSYTAGQAVAAFHQEPALAYNHKSRIWSDDANYSRVFPDSITAGHIFFCYSLLRAVERQKMQIRSVPEQHRTRQQQAQAELFQRRGSNFLIVATVARALEVVLNRPIQNLFDLRFKWLPPLDQAISEWESVVSPTLAFCRQLEKALTEGSLKQSKHLASVLDTVVSLLEASRDGNAKRFSEFAKTVNSGS